MILFENDFGFIENDPWKDERICGRATNLVYRTPCLGTPCLGTLCLGTPCLGTPCIQENWRLTLVMETRKLQECQLEKKRKNWGWRGQSGPLKEISF